MKKKDKDKDKVKLNDYTRKQVMANDFPQIYIIEMKDRPNGDCDVTLNTNKAFDDFYKKKKGCNHNPFSCLMLSGRPIIICKTRRIFELLRLLTCRKSAFILIHAGKIKNLG